MIVLLAAAVLLTAPQDPAEFSRAAFTAGVCGSLGWATSREAADALGPTVAAENPDLTDEQIVALATQAAEATGREIEGGLRSATDMAAFDRWAADMEARCDAVVAAYPTLIQRGPETAATWVAMKQQLAAQFVQ